MDALHDSLHGSVLDREVLSPPWSALGRDLTLGLVSGLGKLLLRGLNTLHVEPDGLHRFRDLTMQREEGVGLLTYSNHTSTFDDPGLPSALLPWWLFWTEHSHGKMRWTMCARDVCFLNDIMRQFFLNGKALPVERGGGAAQPVIGVAARRLAAGDWMHVFPEGRVQPAGDVGAFRQGIGKLVCDARAASGRDPVVLPYFHSGMAHVMPYFSSVPRFGNEVTVVVGEPLDLGAVTCRCNQPGEDQQEVWRDIAAVLREALLQLEARAPPNPNQLEERPGLAEEIAIKGAIPSSPAASPTDGLLAAGFGLSWAQGAAAAAPPPPNRWCNALERPYWAEDQELRQRLWAEGRMQGRRGAEQHQHDRFDDLQQQGALPEDLGLEEWPLAGGLGSKHPGQQRQQQQQQEQQRDALGRWRWPWRRQPQGGDAQQQALLQARQHEDRPQHAALPAHRQPGLWQWAWRRRRQLSQEAHGHSGPDGGSAWADTSRRVASARQQCVA